MSLSLQRTGRSFFNLTISWRPDLMVNTLVSSPAFPNAVIIKVILQRRCMRHFMHRQVHTPLRSGRMRLYPSQRWPTILEHKLLSHHSSPPMLLYPQTLLKCMPRFTPLGMVMRNSGWVFYLFGIHQGCTKLI